VSDRLVQYVCLLAMVAGAMLQLFFLSRGFYSISWDDSGRTLDAYSWARHGVVQMKEWLPFYRVIVGSALQVFPDLVAIPRVIAGLFGLATIPAAGWLANELFLNRRTTLVTLLCAAFFSQRVALSLAPVSAIMFIFFVVCGLALFCRWLRTRHSKALYGSAGLIAIACTERYEGWLFATAILVAACLRNPRPSRRQLAALALILFAFPLGSTVHRASTSSIPIATLKADSQQHSTKDVVLKNPLVEFLTTNGRSLNLAGMALWIPWVLGADRRLRIFAAAAFGPLVVLALGLLLLFVAQTGPSWRLIGVWSLLLLPWTAHLLVRLSQPTPWPRGATVFLGALLIASFLLDTRRIERASGWAFPESDRAAGAFVRRAVEANPATTVWIESSKYFYLNVVVASQHPDAFRLSPAPPKERRDGMLLLFQTPEQTRLMDAERDLLKLGQFGPWSVYGCCGVSFPGVAR